MNPCIRSIFLFLVLSAWFGESALAAPSELDRSKFPEPVFDREPGFVDLYWKACELAHAHILTQPGLPQPRYMDEAFQEDRTCFQNWWNGRPARADWRLVPPSQFENTLSQ